MTNAISSNIFPNADSRCCMLQATTGNEPYGCAERKAIFTRREQRVLSAIHEVSFKAGKLKDSMRSQIKGGNDSAPYDLEKLAQELESLRQIRAELEKERVAAAHERMVLLGHA